MLRFTMLWIFLPTLAAAGFFSNYIDKYLNQDIQPCDDFYEHVCSNAENGHRFHEEAANWFYNLLQQQVSPEIREFRNQVEGNNKTFPDVEMEPEDLKEVDKLFERTGLQCMELSPFLKLICAQVDCTDSFLLEAIETYEAHNRMQNTPHYSILKYKMADIFTGLKDIVTREFLEAPWTKRHPQFVDSIKNVKLVHLEVEDLKMGKEAMEIKQRFESCLGVVTKKTRTASEKCLSYALCPTKLQVFNHPDSGEDVNLFQHIIFYRYGMLSFNAAYPGNNTVTLNPPLYTLKDDELPFMLGSLDFVLSHEMGHVFFHRGGAIPSNSECFRKHIQSTCNEYVEDKTECEEYDKIYINRRDWKPQVNANYSRLGDDASDWIGMHAGLISLRKHYPNVFNGTDTESSADLMKKFFYAHAINWCSQKPNKGDISHSPMKVRVNGIPSLFPEFSEVFQCKRGSRMAKAATCLPFAGVGAPTRRRHHLQ